MTRKWTQTAAGFRRRKATWLMAPPLAVASNGPIGNGLSVGVEYLYRDLEHRGEGLLLGGVITTGYRVAFRHREPEHQVVMLTCGAVFSIAPKSRLHLTWIRRDGPLIEGTIGWCMLSDSVVSANDCLQTDLAWQLISGTAHSELGPRRIIGVSAL
jgi:hypothetical protein